MLVIRPGWKSELESFSVQFRLSQPILTFLKCILMGKNPLLVGNCFCLMSLLCSLGVSFISPPYICFAPFQYKSLQAEGNSSWHLCNAFTQRARL